MVHLRDAAVVAAALAAAAPAFAQLGDLDEAFRTTSITSEDVGDGLHVLFGVGGAIVVSIGEQGVLAVDDQFPQMAPKYNEKVRELGGGDIDFVINTHWHFDHADGNQALGPEGTWIVAHENSRRMLLQDNVINLVTSQRDQPAYPPAALPVITFADGMMFHFNGEPIELLHFGPAHTTGDTAVIFRNHNVVHMGDDGASLEQVIAARPTEQFDERYGDPQNFVNRAYTSLTRDR